MKQKKIIPFPLFVSIALVLGICFFLTAGSCTFTTEGFTLLSGDYSSPILDDFILESETQAKINFSRNVEFPKLEYYELQKVVDSAETASESVDSALVDTVNVQLNAASEDESSFEYILTFSKNLSADTKYILSGTVKDEIGSTLSFSIGFSGYNSRVPKMIFSEVSTEYSKPRTEFVELYVLEDGNLAGVILHSASDGVDKDFIFPSVEVKKGEYVVLHMRTVEEGAVNELGSDVTLSNTKQSSSEGRDLWISGTDTRFSKNDVLLLRERLNGSLLDAVVYTDGNKTEWPKDSIFAFAEEAHSASLWEGGVDVSQAANIEYITGTRTFCRQNIADIVLLFEQGQRTFANSKDDWIIVATSNLSPGKENSTKEYVKK